MMSETFINKLSLISGFCEPKIFYKSLRLQKGHLLIYGFES